MWTAALDEAVTASDSDAVGRIGFQAHVASEAGAAIAAWAHIARLDEPGAAWLRRAAVFSRTRREPRAEIPPRQRLLDELSEAEYGPDHAEVAGTLDNLGNAWRELGQPEKARDLHERALRIFEREYGPDHAEVARTLTNLGTAWRDLGKPEKARDLYMRALRILYAHFPNGHPHCDLVVHNLRRIDPDLIVLDDGRVVSRPGVASPTGS